MAEKSKYDTNPLDPDAGRRAAAAFGDEATRALPVSDTRPQGGLAEDPPTLRYGGAPDPYQSVYQQSPPAPHSYQAPYVQYQTPPGYQYPPAAYPPQQTPVAPTPAAPPVAGGLTSRPVAGLNLPENLMVIAPYIPMYVGAIAGLAELFLTPQHEKRVRFHAAQGLALHLVIMVVPAFLGIALKIGELAGAWVGLLGLGTKLFSVVASIFLIIYLCKVWQGKDKPIEILSNLTAWLNENIAPRK